MDGSKRLVASLAMGVTGVLARGVRPLGLLGAAGVVLARLAGGDGRWA